MTFYKITLLKTATANQMSRQMPAPITNSIKKLDKIMVDEPRVYCDGSVVVGAGHPGVYLNLRDKKEIECPYCGAIFAKNQSKI